MRDSDPHSLADLARQLEIDAALDPSIRPGESPPQPGRSRRARLLTGATGFLGTQLLADLLEYDDGEVFCVTRARDPENAAARLRHALSAQSRWRDGWSSRILPVVGDLAQLGLGLPDHEWRRLADSVDVVYHNGAWINLVYPYEALSPTNVRGTAEILRLACARRPLPVHFVSSLAVFSSSQYASTPRIDERFRVGSSAGLNRGYSQTKWAAERLVGAAAERGLPVWIYRPGPISGHSETGICNVRDRLSLLLGGCMRMRAAPALDGVLHLTPVNYVSRSIVALSSSRLAANQAFHIVAAAPIAWMDVVDVLREATPDLALVPYDNWLSDLRRGAQESPRTALLPLSAMMGSDPPFQRNRARNFDSTNTLAGLAAHPHIRCPTDGRSLIRRYVQFLEQEGSL